MIQLSTLIDETPREFNAGRGVVFTWRPATYAEYLLAKQRAQTHIQQSAVALRADGKIGDDAEPHAALEAIALATAEAEAIMAEEIVLAATISWRGVGDPKGVPMPFSREAWRAYARALPNEADGYALQVLEPNLAIETEGNGSTPAHPGAAAGETPPVKAAPESSSSAA
ncbi:MAG: hypothetical protein AAF713_20595 [Pseudomonadota bacterium]